MRSLTTQWLVLIMAGMSVLFSACEAPKAFPCEKGVGERVTEVRTVAPFDKIILDATGDLYITRDSVFDVQITAQENVLEIIETNVNGDILEIINTRCVRQSKTIRIDISLPDVSLLEVKGSGDIYGMDRFTSAKVDLVISGSGSIEWMADAEAIRSEIIGSGDIVLNTHATELSSKILGSGDLSLEGDCNIHDINIDASGRVKSFGLNTHSTYVSIAGSGDSEVRADSLLDVKILGSGNVHYKGTPGINVKITGSGRLINAN